MATPTLRKSKPALLTATTAVLALGLLAAAVVPSVLADARPSSLPGARSDPPGDDRVQAKRFEMNLTGTGTDRANATYTFELLGAGRGRLQHDADGNRTLLGRAEVRIVIRASNGTVLKDRTETVFVRLHQGPAGDWKWQLVAFHLRGVPQLGLRGNATQDARGVFGLDGHGRVAFRVAGSPEPTFVRLQVQGQIGRL